MSVMLLLLVASSEARLLVKPQPLRDDSRVLLRSLRGGALAPADIYAKANFKLVPGAAGGAIDLLAGTVAGAIPGFIVGAVISTATKGALNVGVFLFSNMALTAAFNGLLTKLGCLEFKMDKICAIPLGIYRQIVPKKLRALIFKQLDIDQDGDIDDDDALVFKDWADSIFGKLTGNTTKTLDSDGDGKLTKDDAKRLVEANPHAAVGLIAGFSVACVKGLACVVSTSPRSSSGKLGGKVGALIPKVSISAA